MKAAKNPELPHPQSPVIILQSEHHRLVGALAKLWGMMILKPNAIKDPK